MGMAAYADQGFIVKRNLPTMIGLGRLVDLVIRDVKGQRQRVTPSSELWFVSSGVKSGHVRISRSGVKSGHPVVISLKNPRREVSFHAS